MKIQKLIAVILLIAGIVMMIGSYQAQPINTATVFYSAIAVVIGFIWFVVLRILEK